MKAKFYNRMGDNFYFGYESDTKEKRLAAGRYRWVTPMFGQPYLKLERPSEKDGQVDLKGNMFNQILNDINKFLLQETKERYKKFSLLHKRGILVYGKQGAGKTSLFERVMDDFVKNDGIVFISPDVTVIGSAISEIREVEPERQILIVLEEIDSILNRGDESELLQLLDGANSFDNIIYLASTNYIEQIPARLKNRPSRFARVVELGPPEAEVREQFIVTKFGSEFNKKEIRNLVAQTEGLVLDQIKDVVVSVLCFDIPLDEAIQKIRDMEESDDDEIDLDDEEDEY